MAKQGIRNILLQFFLVLVFTTIPAWCFRSIPIIIDHNSFVCREPPRCSRDARAPCHFGSSSSSSLAPRKQRRHGCSALNYKNYREMQVDLDAELMSGYDSSADATLSSTTNGRGGDTRWHRVIGNRCQRLFQRLWIRLWQWHQRIKMFWETYTIYVLECENAKYYVGSTSCAPRRLQQHADGQGAAWTRLHKPVRVAFLYKRVPTQYYLGMEAKITAEWMLKYGVNNVRGAMFAETRPYTSVRSHNVSIPKCIHSFWILLQNFSRLLRTFVFREPPVFHLFIPTYIVGCR